jgi:hypothetical protein
MVVPAYNPSSQDVKAGESQVQGQLGLHSETLTQKRKRGKRDAPFHIFIPSIHEGPSSALCL